MHNVLTLIGKVTGAISNRRDFTDRAAHTNTPNMNNSIRIMPIAYMDHSESVNLSVGAAQMP